MSSNVRWPLLASLLALAGCASYPQQRGMAETAALASERGVVATVPDASACTLGDPTIASLLAAPLGVDGAIRIVLTCNPELAAEYARLGIARAEVFQAGRLANPSLSIGRVGADGASPTTLTLGLTQNFSQLILRGPRLRLSEGEFLRTQQLLAGRVLEVVAETMAAWHRLQAASHTAQLADLSADAAEAAADLSQRFHDAGNRSPRELALDQASAAEAVIAARKSGDDVAKVRADLLRLLGLPASIAWALPDRLALPPPGEALAVAALQQQASRQRLDLIASRGLVDLLADSRDVARRWRWLGEFSVGVERERESGGARTLEPGLSIQLPLFDRGEAGVARAAAWQEWSEAERRRLDLRVASDVAVRAASLQSARASVVDFGERLLPQRRNVVARLQEDVNYMLRGPFELLQARRDEYATAIGYVEAIADYWIARAELERAIGARLPLPADGGSIDVAELAGARRAATDPAHSQHRHGTTSDPAPDPSKMDHSKMDHSKMDHSTMDHAGASPKDQPVPVKDPGDQP